MDEFLGEFDRWNKKKQMLASDRYVCHIYPHRGEVWICSLGWNVGREQNGNTQDFMRPVLIINRFNSELFWVVPLSTKQKEIDYYYNYTDAAGNDVSVILAQMRLVSIKRLQRYMHRLLSVHMHVIGKQLAEFCEGNNRSPARGGASRNPIKGTV